MDLFSELKGQTVIPELDSWKYYFDDTTILKAKSILDKLYVLRNTRTIYPEQEDILRIFRDLKPNDVKVVILGQDPYHDGNAMGYAFGCKKHITPSLAQIFSSIGNLPRELHSRNITISLEYLVEQGVMLLNTILTVDKGYPNSHSNVGWQHFTTEFLYNFSSLKKNVVYMLWGKSAKNYKKYISEVDNLILEDVHPVYASRNNVLWDCNHFSIANAYLKQNNKETIKWN